MKTHWIPAIIIAQFQKTMHHTAKAEEFAEDWAMLGGFLLPDRVSGNTGEKMPEVTLKRRGFRRSD